LTRWPDEVPAAFLVDARMARATLVVTEVALAVMLVVMAPPTAHRWRCAPSTRLDAPMS
jgi:hypothetical protein